MTRLHYQLSADEAAMARLAQQLAPAVTSGMRIYFTGDLGTGKTTFIRALLRALGHHGAVKSPTYGLIEPYDLPQLGAAYHLDLYRLADPEELDYLGLRDLLAERALLLIEWPEQGAGELPEPDLLLKLEHAGSQRALCFVASSRPAQAAVDGLIAVQALFNKHAIKQPST